MPLTPLVPAGPVREDRPRWNVAVSVLLHLLAVALLIGIAAWQKRPEPGGSPSYDLIFEAPPSGTPSPSKPALPPMQPADIPPPDAPPGPPAPTPLTAPSLDVVRSPPPAQTASPPPPPAPTPPTTLPKAAPAPAPAASAAPPDLALAPPDEPATIPPPAPAQAVPNQEPPAVRLEVPQTQEAPAAPQPIMPVPPPPLPSPRAPPAPRSAQGTLSNPMDLSFGPAAPRPAARGSVASRAIDLSPPPERSGPTRSDPYAAIRAANASADWNRGLLQYWLRHRYYPQQAAESGEEGSVTIQLTVNRSGRVEKVQILSRSGSPWLDMAAVGAWRDAKLPPFTNEMREERLTFPIPITYYLVR